MATATEFLNEQIGARAPSVFLSHASLDGVRYAQRLDRDLRRSGVKTWLYPRDLVASLDFTAVLEQEIKSADVFVACVTEKVLRPDSYVRREISYAQGCSKPITVARFEPILPPISVITNTFFEFHQDWSTAFERLLAFINGVTA